MPVGQNVKCSTTLLHTKTEVLGPPRPIPLVPLHALCSRLLAGHEEIFHPFLGEWLYFLNWNLFWGDGLRTLPIYILKLFQKPRG